MDRTLLTPRPMSTTTVPYAFQAESLQHQQLQILKPQTFNSYDPNPCFDKGLDSCPEFQLKPTMHGFCLQPYS